MNKLALDVEGVLVHHLKPWIDKKKSEGVEINIEKITWGFDNFPKEYLKDFLSYTNELWEKDWKAFPPLESNVSDLTRELFRLTHYDILTFRNKVPSIKKWLSWNGIPFSRVIYTDDKISLGYLIYVDDCPLLAEQVKENQVLLLYDRPWNKHVETNKRVRRVQSLEEVLEYVKRRFHQDTLTKHLEAIW